MATCGVWACQTVSRKGVVLINKFLSVILIVSLAGLAKSAAPYFLADLYTSSISLLNTNGLTALWTPTRSFLLILDFSHLRTLKVDSCLDFSARIILIIFLKLFFFMIFFKL